MLPEVIKYRLWTLALRMNPQRATYRVRTVSGQVNVPDSFLEYALLRVTYRELTSEEIALVGVALADSYRVWTIYQVDLDQALSPAPVPTHELELADGTIWIIERVRGVAMNQAFECLCHPAK